LFPSLNDLLLQTGVSHLLPKLQSELDGNYDFLSLLEMLLIFFSNQVFLISFKTQAF